MKQDPTRLQERAAVLALVAASPAKWHVTASLIEEAGTAVGLLEQTVPATADAMDTAAVRMLAAVVKPHDVSRYAAMIVDLEQRGIAVITVLDREYPANLRDIYNRPPMLFVKGQLLDADDRAIAIVGTRKPSADGLREAERLAAEFAVRGVTVLSGLARGIDTAAHEAALGAGGRTVAVMGTGINSIYPPENEPLARRVEERGALVSQFWPDAPPNSYNFPMRNVVMSGMGLGTVVVEAGPTSGARLQARRAIEHGKRLFLFDSLVMRQQWARTYARHPGVTVVRSVDQILPLVDTLSKPERELTLF